MRVRRPGHHGAGHHASLLLELPTPHPLPPQGGENHERVQETDDLDHGEINWLIQIQ